MPAARCASGYPFHSTGLPHLGQLARRCFYKNQRNQANQIAAVAALSPGVFLKNRANQRNQEIKKMRLKIF